MGIIILIITVLYLAAGIVYSWKISKDLRSFFKVKKDSNKGNASNKKFKKIFNPTYIPWYALEVILVIFWLPLLIYERKTGLQ